ncbi:MAG: hypothetical protein NCW75_02380 [Phycisphaera sp.]|nr:MAG: hypothetical protein NCW75_02380 [Phycisphaera sp.]
MSTTTPTPTRKAQRKTALADPRVALVALNAALLLALGTITLAPSATAQQAQRPRGEYMVLGGQMTGSPSSAVHIIDTSNQEMVTLKWNQSSTSFEGVGYRNLRLDAQGQTGGGR